MALASTFDRHSSETHDDAAFFLSHIIPPPSLRRATSANSRSKSEDFAVGRNLFDDNDAGKGNSDGISDCDGPGSCMGGAQTVLDIVFIVIRCHLLAVDLSLRLIRSLENSLVEPIYDVRLSLGGHEWVQPNKS